MKKTALLIFSFITLGFLCAASCEKEDDNTPDDNINAEMIVGAWQVDMVTFNGEQVTPENMLIIMHDDGSGMININGVVENNDFTWVLNGDKLTINHHNGQAEYTIKDMTENDCSLVGTTIPATDMVGDVTMHLQRVR